MGGYTPKQGHTKSVPLPTLRACLYTKARFEVLDFHTPYWVISPQNSTFLEGPNLLSLDGRLARRPDNSKFGPSKKVEFWGEITSYHPRTCPVKIVSTSSYAEKRLLPMRWAQQNREQDTTNQLADRLEEKKCGRNFPTPIFDWETLRRTPFDPQSSN